MVVGYWLANCRASNALTVHALKAYIKHMGTIFVFRNIRFVVHSKDHPPPHVHAISPKGEAKVDLDSIECFYSRGYSHRDIKMIEKFVKEHHETFMEAWNEFHS